MLIPGRSADERVNFESHDLNKVVHRHGVGLYKRQMIRISYIHRFLDWARIIVGLGIFPGVTHVKHVVGVCGSTCIVWFAV